jgi:2-polyprenyl-3-methyl-5-hydroxy-6-metoxy-1,4-benzoquinol methylase
MSVREQVTVEQVAEQRDALAGRLFQSMLGTMDLLTIYLGDRLGLYRALDEIGWATPAVLAERAGVAERYSREWLEQQAVTGVLEVDDPGAEAPARRYRLPVGHREVLLDRDSLSYLAFLGRFAVAASLPMPKLLEAFRTGGGVSWAEYGVDAREGQAEQNRPVFFNLLAKEWLPSMPELHARLQAAPSALVADIGCGGGWLSIAVAQAYPRVRIDGFDVDEASVRLARANAAAAGVADRVSFHLRDVAEPAPADRYDLVIAFEMIHDLARPAEVLRAMRGLAADDGTVIVVDERVAESFTAPGDELERLFYGFSVLCCLATGMTEQPSAATGTVMRPATLARYAEEAGFRGLEILPIEHDFFRLYRLVI